MRELLRIIQRLLPRRGGAAPIVPERSVAGRTLLLMITIMSFLSAVTLGGVVLVQKSAIARAVIARPKVLLADEPTGNVDPDLSSRLVHLFAELNRTLGMTIILATHELPLLDQFSYPRMLLSKGELVIHA